MDQKLWALLDQYRGHFHAENYLIALSYYYLKALSKEEAESDLLKTGIKADFAQKLSASELKVIDQLLEERVALEEIKELVLHLFNMVDYSRRMMRASSNDSILNLASRFLNFDEGTFADFCSGNGTMLNKALENQASDIRGIEIDEMTHQLSILRLWLEHGELYAKEVVQADVFEYFETHNEKYDQIFSEFPINMMRAEKYVFEGVNIHKHSDWGFIALVMNQLKEDGRAVVISSVGIETRKPDEEIREHFIRKGYIEKVIALPARILTGTAIPSFMLVLSSGNESIRFTDASEIYSKAGRVRLFEEEDIDRIIHSEDISADVPLEKVLREGRLSPEFYLLPEIKGGMKLEKIAEVLNSRSVRKKEIDEYSAVESTGFQLIRLSHVKNGQILEGDFIREAIPKLVELKNLDILVTRTGSTLNVALYQKEEDMQSFVDENFFVLRVNNKEWNPYYLFAYLQSEMGQKYLSSAYSGATIQRINKRDIVQLEIPVIETSLQQKMAEKIQEYLDEVDRLQLALAVVKDEKNETINSWFKEA